PAAIDALRAAVLRLRAADAALAAPPPSGRLTFDDARLVVTLDGTPHRVDDPRAYAVYKAIAQRTTPTITKAAIQEQEPGIKGRKTVYQLAKKLPEPLYETVHWDTTGYWHTLP